MEKEKSKIVSLKKLYSMIEKLRDRKNHFLKVRVLAFELKILLSRLEEFKESKDYEHSEIVFGPIVMEFSDRIENIRFASHWSINEDGPWESQKPKKFLLSFFEIELLYKYWMERFFLDSQPECGQRYNEWKEMLPKEMAVLFYCERSHIQFSTGINHFKLYSNLDAPIKGNRRSKKSEGAK